MTTPKPAHREFWLHFDNAYGNILGTANKVNSDDLHVIEFSRVLELEQEVQGLKLEIDTRAKPMVEKLKAENAQLRAEVGKLKEEASEYPALEKVYRMNRDWIEDAKVRLDALKAENEKLKEETERLRISLAGCGVAALCNTEKSMREQLIEKDSPYWSASYGDVITTVKREMVLRDERDGLREALEEIAKFTRDGESTIEAENAIEIFGQMEGEVTDEIALQIGRHVLAAYNEWTKKPQGVAVHIPISIPSPKADEPSWCMTIICDMPWFVETYWEYNERKFKHWSMKEWFEKSAGDADE